MAKNKLQSIGILTSGGDCQGLNAAIRGVARTAMKAFGLDVVGIRDGFRGLVENRSAPLADDDLSGILTLGGTILGTSRDKPNKMPFGGRTVDMTKQAVENYPPPIAKGKRLKIYYGTQTGTNPIYFKVFVNNPDYARSNWLAYLQNRFREAFGLEGAPIFIKLVARSRPKK